MARPPAGAKYFNLLAVQVAGRPFVPVFAVVRHRGRTSGREYSTPVIVLKAPGAFVVPIVWGKESDWVRNVLAAGGGTVRYKGQDHAVTDPQIVGVEEARAAAPSLLHGALERLPGGGDFLRLRRDG
ncbi:hypothetical protein N802_13075 [Knoellia sinensis KCTC 19936]|uniref:Nitroreductase n=1 Tax=Knoellia sinensis KCTC 19936 TaxID=1385520 RepID=A0A0A0JAV8_9MICO|nr:nitroreductase family deazaflavin-dependent oxidoreductase [Knoellia sinensis]KGN34288.1 hypothetical protein N802_13075 [Knoellia sinensis KCTC 19936]